MTSNATSKTFTYRYCVCHIMHDCHRLESTDIGVFGVVEYQYVSSLTSVMTTSSRREQGLTAFSALRRILEPGSYSCHDCPNRLVLGARSKRIRKPLSPAIRTWTNSAASAKINIDIARGKYSNFARLRATGGYAYFDRTKYITLLDSPANDIILFLRPRRFGKSLTLSMLDHFHSVILSPLLQIMDLDVHKDVQENKVRPGEYLVLKFDFSTVGPTRNMVQGERQLSDSIIGGLLQFYDEHEDFFEVSASQLESDNIDRANAIYSLTRLIRLVNRVVRRTSSKEDRKHHYGGVKGVYLLVDEYDAFSNQFMDPNGKLNWIQTPIAILMKTFWASMKSFTSLDYGIQRCFITGISPLSLVSISSGFNIAVNVSFDEDFTGLCGLTRADVKDALERVCDQTTGSVEEHLNSLARFANGYHFCNYKLVEPVFNTNTCLEYLQSVLSRRPSTLADPPNSEVSEVFLRTCASAPAAIGAMEAALAPPPHSSSNSRPYHNRLPYSRLVNQFNPIDLQCDLLNDKSEVWRSLLVYFGGFTFDKENPSEFLTIPNLIAARRFGTALLDHFGLLSTMEEAMRFLTLHGKIEKVLGGYKELMAKRDVYDSGYAMKERDHRDSFYVYTLANHALYSKPEYRITTLSGHLGFIDLVISLPNHFIVTEWKAINIEFVDTKVSLDRQEKADLIAGLDINGVLDLKFNKKERFKKGTIRRWIASDVTAQLRKYVLSQEVQVEAKEREFHAHLVVVVGSRQILIWDMDREGNWIGKPKLAPKMPQVEKKNKF
ncbi:hypothetical protein HOY82DRAFT_625832 [Tuber indicum]|nr:hypothetical protein HOY82DRAFT_625832 [Tuber indicum]